MSSGKATGTLDTWAMGAEGDKLAGLAVGWSRLPAVGHLRDHAYRELRSELISVTALAARLCQRHGLSINA